MVDRDSEADGRGRSESGGPRRRGSDESPRVAGHRRRRAPSPGGPQVAALRLSAPPSLSQKTAPQLEWRGSSPPTRPRHNAPGHAPSQADRPGASRVLHSLKMTTARSVRFFVNLGLGLVFYGLLVTCCTMSLFERGWISSDGARRQHKLPCDSHGPRSWPSNVPDLTWPGLVAVRALQVAAHGPGATANGPLNAPGIRVDTVVNVRRLLRRRRYGALALSKGAARSLLARGSIPQRLHSIHPRVP